MLRSARLPLTTTSFAAALATVLGLCLVRCPTARCDEMPETTENKAGEVAESATEADADLNSAEIEALAENHPLGPVLQHARQALTAIKSVRDYTCILVKRERIDGDLSSYQYMNAKVRHERTDAEQIQPFAVYLRFLRPNSVKGREVLYVEGRNAGQMLARRGGERLSSVTAWIRPDSRMAMKDNRYPITDFGIRNLVVKLLEVGRADLKHQECEVQYFQDAKVNGQTCTHIRVVHPRKRDYFRFHRADIYVHDELKFPIRYAAYDWPDSDGDSPPLLEEYNYVNLKLNVGLKDIDFERNNPDYAFRKEENKLVDGTDPKEVSEDE